MHHAVFIGESGAGVKTIGIILVPYHYGTQAQKISATGLINKNIPSNPDFDWFSLRLLSEKFFARIFISTRFDFPH